MSRLPDTFILLCFMGWVTKRLLYAVRSHSPKIVIYSKEPKIVTAFDFFNILSCRFNPIRSQLKTVLDFWLVNVCMKECELIKGGHTKAPCFKSDVTRDDSQRRFSEQYCVAMMEQCCNHSKQCRSNVVMLCCAKNRCSESSRVTSP